jgi:hypothetical protein
MANTIKERPVDPIFAELARMGAQPNGPLWEYFRTLIPSTDKTLTNKGEIKLQAPIVGRTEGIGITVTNLDSTGKLASTDAIAADGTGSPLTGGKRGFVALDTNNRLANSFRGNPVNVSNAPTSSTTMSNDGVLTVIPISAYSAQFPPGTVSYNSGSVDPGSFGKVFVYFDDPTFAGGAVAYAFTTSPQVQTAAEGRIPVGAITTVSGSAKTGGGTSGGTGGTGGGRGFING